MKTLLRILSRWSRGTMVCVVFFLLCPVVTTAGVIYEWHEDPSTNIVAAGSLEVTRAAFDSGQVETGDILGFNFAIEVFSPLQSVDFASLVISMYGKLEAGILRANDGNDGTIEIGASDEDLWWLWDYGVDTQGLSGRGNWILDRSSVSEPRMLWLFAIPLALVVLRERTNHNQP